MAKYWHWALTLALLVYVAADVVERLKMRYALAPCLRGEQTVCETPSGTVYVDTTRGD
jgi:hypothetical protein